MVRILHVENGQVTGQTGQEPLKQDQMAMELDTATCISSFQFYNQYYEPTSLPDWSQLTNLKIIEDSAFYRYAGAITFPTESELTHIKRNAFHRHKGAIDLPKLDNLETIGDGAFKGGNVEIELNGPFDNLKEIGDEAFHGRQRVIIDTQNEDMPLLETFPGFDPNVQIEATDNTICTPKLQTPVKHVASGVSLSKQHCPKAADDETKKTPESVYIIIIALGFIAITIYITVETKETRHQRILQNRNKPIV